ncbi:MAG TPA: riboflavin synthase subunit alpha, partial [Polyangiaceae bacterium]|nr:riboflavin synthase subunit alpha [Polyangiaceae bacterium]
ELPSPLRLGLSLGASVSVDGVCQTVAGLEGELVYFDAHAETLRVTTLSELREGSLVHIERSSKAGDENGGHLVSGHVDTTLELVEVVASPDNHVLVLRVPAAFAKYIFNKGFVAVHGASLTVTAFDADAGTFRVYLIPETLRLTTFGQKRPGDRLNLEIDRQTQVLVDTLERTLRAVLPQLAKGS